MLYILYTNCIERATVQLGYALLVWRLTVNFKDIYLENLMIYSYETLAHFIIEYEVSKNASLYKSQFKYPVC